MCLGRNIGFFWFFLDGCLRSFCFVRSRMPCFHGLSLCGEEMEVEGHPSYRTSENCPIGNVNSQLSSLLVYI